MNQSVKLSKAISYIVIICAVLLFAAIWPGEFIQQKYISKSNEIMDIESGPVNVENNITQMFVAEEGELNAVHLYVCNDMAGETITFRLYDGSYTELFNTFFVVDKKQEYPGFIRIPVGYDLVKDMDYYFTIEGLSADMTVAYELRETSTSIVNGFMSYGGIELQRYNVIIRYEYTNPFVWWQTALLGIMIAVVTAGVCVLIRKLFASKLPDREVKVQNVFRVILNPIIIVTGAMVCLAVFPGRKFEVGIGNHIFYYASTILLTGILLFLVNFKREGDNALFEGVFVKERIPEYLQSFCVAMVIWYCYEYMNGLYTIHHDFAVRRMLLWFFLGILCTFSKKELLKIYNYVFALGIGVLAYFHARPHLGEEEGELYKLEAYIIVSAGLAIWLIGIRLIQYIRKKEVIQKKWNIPYAIGFAGLMALMIAFRNGRDWLITMTVIFAIFYLRMWQWDKSDKILGIVSNGLIMNFIIMVGYSLLHRPYQRFIFSRYGLGFHTVTMTAMYLSLVLSVIMVKLLKKYYEKKRLLCVWPELFLLSVANAYLIMTLSRTGFMAAIGMEVFMIILFACKHASKKMRTIAKHLVIVGLWAILAFPCTFTVTRMVPAAVNDPILAEIEITGHHVRKGMPTNSRYYMRMEKFLEMVGVKIINAHEDARLYLNPDAIYVTNDEVLLASADDDIEINSSINNISNGRIDIFKEYIANWNLTGHEDMSVVKEDGTSIVHAHNVFLQVAHDHGVPIGILFIVFGVASFVIAFVRFVKNDDCKYAVTLAVILAFAVSGITEWNFQLCQPFAMGLFMVLTPLLFRIKDKENNEQEII